MSIIYFLSFYVNFCFEIFNTHVTSQKRTESFYVTFFSLSPPITVYLSTRGPSAWHLCTGICALRAGGGRSLSV